MTAREGPIPGRHLGLDLGGTNIKAVVVEHGDEWRVLDRDQIATQGREGADAVIGRLIEIGRELMDRNKGVSTVGVGVPGLYDPTAGTARFFVNIAGAWDGKPIAAPVRAALGVPVALINDARAFGVAELRLGAGRGAASMVGITLGTGVGGVIAIDGHVVQGHDGTAGELGHQTLDPNGPECGCGNRGCLEAFARGDRIATACGTATPEEAIDRARGGDRIALDGFASVGRWLGIGIGNMISVVTPDRIVIGGGLAVAADLMLEAIRTELRKHVFTTSLDEVELRTAELGTWAGAIGAAVHGAEHATLSAPSSAR